MRKIISFAALGSAALALAACDVDQTEEGALPDVDVEGGNLPEYDVEGPDVDVGTREVEVPDTVTLPDVDISGPDDAEGVPVTGDE